MSALRLLLHCNEGGESINCCGSFGPWRRSRNLEIFCPGSISNQKKKRIIIKKKHAKKRDSHVPTTIYKNNYENETRWMINMIMWNVKMNILDYGCARFLFEMNIQVRMAWFHILFYGIVVIHLKNKLLKMKVVCLVHAAPLRPFFIYWSNWRSSTNKW